MKTKKKALLAITLAMLMVISLLHINILKSIAAEVITLTQADFDEAKANQGTNVNGITWDGYAHFYLDEGSYVLSENIDLGLSESYDGIWIRYDKTVELDINGKTISGGLLVDSSKLVIKGSGTIDYQITLYDDAEVIIENCIYHNSYSFDIDLYDDSMLTIEDGIFSGVSTHDNAKLIINGGSCSKIWLSDNSEIIINDGTIEKLITDNNDNITLTQGTINELSLSNGKFVLNDDILNGNVTNVCIYGENTESIIENGTCKRIDVFEGGKLTIEDGTFSTLWVQSNVTINNATITGMIYVIYGGETVINNADVNGGIQVREDGYLEINGGSFSSDWIMGALHVYQGAKSVVINGGEFVGNSLACLYIEESVEDVVKISSGIFKTLPNSAGVQGYAIWFNSATDPEVFNNLLVDGSSYSPALETKINELPVGGRGLVSQSEISVLKAGEVPPVQGTLTGQGIYCAQDNPSIIAAFLTEKSVASDTVEYRWLACEESNPNTWFEVSPWTKDNYYLSWTPDNTGNYIIVAYARLVGNEEKTLIQDSFGVNFKKNSDLPVTPETPSIPQIPETPASDKIISQGIYCSQTSPSIIAGLVVDNKDSISGDIEYQWLVLNESTGAWAVASDWTKNNEWMNYTPGVSGNYIFVCNARIVGKDNTNVQYSFGTPFEKQGGIKQICQMPHEGGGYLIGFESYENPNQEYKYQMLVLDLSLLSSGSATPWVYATDKIKLSAGATPEAGKTMWTVWNPEYGYYITLFRLYDKDDNMIDEVSYGFANAY